MHTQTRELFCFGLLFVVFHFQHPVETTVDGFSLLFLFASKKPRSSGRVASVMNVGRVRMAYGQKRFPGCQESDPYGFPGLELWRLPKRVRPK